MQWSTQTWVLHTELILELSFSKSGGVHDKLHISSADWWDLFTSPGIYTRLQIEGSSRDRQLLVSPPKDTGKRSSSLGHRAPLNWSMAVGMHQCFLVYPGIHFKSFICSLVNWTETMWTTEIITFQCFLFVAQKVSLLRWHQRDSRYQRVIDVVQTRRWCWCHTGELWLWPAERATLSSW